MVFEICKQQKFYEVHYSCSHPLGLQLWRPFLSARRPLTVLAVSFHFRFHDKVQINILNGTSRAVPVTAHGTGTTVVTDPPMLPSLNLGPHFSKGPLLRRFTLTNSGRRHQSLVWGTEGFSFVQKPKRGGLLRPINMKDMKYKVSPKATVYNNY